MSHKEHSHKHEAHSSGPQSTDGTSPPQQPAVEKKVPETDLTAALNEAKDYKDKYLRALAEIENSRKRLTREKLESQSLAIQNVIVDFLEPLDHLEQALQHASNFTGEVKAWSQGFQMILQQFFQVLQSYDVSSFASIGMAFDPNLHEAIEVEERSDMQEGTVVYEFKKGYKMGAKTVRPAKVRVAQMPKEVEQDVQEKESNNKSEER